MQSDIESILLMEIFKLFFWSLFLIPVFVFSYYFPDNNVLTSRKKNPKRHFYTTVSAIILLTILFLIFFFAPLIIDLATYNVTEVNGTVVEIESERVLLDLDNGESFKRTEEEFPSDVEVGKRYKIIHTQLSKKIISVEEIP